MQREVLNNLLENHPDVKFKNGYFHPQIEIELALSYGGSNVFLNRVKAISLGDEFISVFSDKGETYYCEYDSLWLVKTTEKPLRTGFTSKD